MEKIKKILIFLTLQGGDSNFYENFHGIKI